MFETVLFDFDGTLTPSLEYWLSAFVYALDQFGVEMEESELIRRCFYRPYDDVALELDLPSGNALRLAVHDGLLISFRGATLFPGVLPVLGSLRARGVPMGLVTSSPRIVVDQALEELDLAGFFDTVVASEDSPHHKPHPAPLNLALQRMGRTANQAVYVGDYIVDILAGRAAGMATALHLPDSHSRFYDFEALRGAKPDFEFSKYGALIDYLVI